MTPQQLIDRATIWQRAQNGEGVLRVANESGTYYDVDPKGDTFKYVTDQRYTLMLAAPPPAPLPCPCCGSTATTKTTMSNEYRCSTCLCNWIEHRRAPCPTCAGDAKTTVEVDAFRRDRDAWKEAYYEAYRVSKGWEEEAIESSAKLEELNARVEKGKKQFAEMRGDIESLRADVAQAKGDQESFATLEGHDHA